MDYTAKFNEFSDNFLEYGQSFLNDDQDLQSAVRIKTDHTFRVCDEIILLSESLGLDERNCFISKCTALLHDIGRFEQFKLYRTFSDRKSVNHAELAVTIIDKLNFLKDLENSSVEIIKTAVKYHNAKLLPDGLDKTQEIFCKLVRDADKLDIFRIAALHYSNPQPGHKETIEVGIPDIPSVTPEVCESVYRGESVDFSRIRSLNDFKIIQAGWVYDLNFQASFSLLKTRGHLDVICGCIPQTPEVNRVIEKTMDYLDRQSQPVR
jgi:hypothetical protein